MNKNRPCPPDFIGENHVPSRYPAPPGAPKPKFLDALDKTEADSDYSLPVKKDPKTGLLYTIPIGDEVFEAIDNEAEARRQALAEERAQSVQELANEAKDRFEQVMAIDEVNQHRVNEEKAARESQDNLLGDRIDRHEVKVDELHVEADRVHNSKLDKNFANAEISTLPVSSSDYIVIVSNGNTYRVTLEQLATLISQKTDYFKGQYSSLDHLNSQGFDGLQGGDYAYVDTLFTNEDGSTYYQFVTYVWDVEDGRWEETKSTQYATQADYTALVQSLVDGSFNLGSVKVNSSPEESPLLKSLYVNQKHYSLPATEIEVSDEFVEGAYDMYSITFNGNTWNVPKNVVQIEFSDKNVEGVPTLGSITIGGATWNLVSADFVNNAVANKQNKLTAGEGISISEDGVISVTFTAPVTEEWDGSYEEISNGHTVTLQLGTYDPRNPFTSDTGYTYSIDGGVTKIPLYNQNAPVVLNNVQTIGFYGVSAICLYLGSTPEGNEFGKVHGGNGIYENIITIDNDTVIYISASEMGSGGAGD